jgi:hypothetical protein
MRCKGRVAALMMALAAMPVATASGNEPVTTANWQNHPAIVEIRKIYQKIEQDKEAGHLRKEQRTFAYCHPYDDGGDRTVYLDSGGDVRSYQVVRGSDDSAAQAAYYYDRDGALRFVLAKAGAVNGTAYEYRIYLAKSGERLWQDLRHVEGPGYSFPAELPDDWLVRDPKQAFAAPDPCEKR